METGDRKKKVLFVDDEENILRSLERLFIDEPYEVITAASGRDGLDLLARNSDAALIVSDQRMPGMTGAEFLERSRELAPDAMRVVLTGYADMQAAVDAINRGGAYRYLAKPWKDDELVQTVREAVERHSLVRENKRLTEVVRQQNEELKKWNDQLQFMVQEQTIDIQKKNRELQGLTERLRKNFSDSLSAFSGLLELRDGTAASHSRNVSELAGAMARAMGMPAEETGAIAVAALLHDIGKIGIPDALLGRKYEDMTPEDRARYMTHPVRGQAAIDAIEDLRKAGFLIRHHHERFDGAGFPDGLKGDAIPFGSRIIAICDHFDRTIGKYQGANAVDRTLAEIRNGLGTGFDPRFFPVLAEPARDIYGKGLQTGVVEIDLNPKDLKAGMTLCQDVRSGTGLLLLRSGTVLNQKNIEALGRYFQIDPSENKVTVMTKG